MVDREDQDSMCIGANKSICHSCRSHGTKIAALLGVSVYRRRGELGILIQGQNISDEDLYSAIRKIQVRSLNIAEVLILGQLRAQQYAVTRNRVRRVV